MTKERIVTITTGAALVLLYSSQPAAAYREYQAKLARFAQRDPLYLGLARPLSERRQRLSSGNSALVRPRADLESVNLYASRRSSPMLFSDSSGLLAAWLCSSPVRGCVCSGCTTITHEQSTFSRNPCTQADWDRLTGYMDRWLLANLAGNCYSDTGAGSKVCSDGMGDCAICQKGIQQMENKKQERTRSGEYVCTRIVAARLTCKCPLSGVPTMIIIIVP